MSTQQKIADVFLALPPAKAAETLKLLTEQEVLKTGEALLLYSHKETRKKSGISDPDGNDTMKDDSVQVTEDTQRTSFLKTVAQQHSGLEVAKALFRLAFGPRRASELVSILLKRQMASHFSFLSYYSVEQLFEVLKLESPYIIGFVLEVVDATTAARLLRLFPMNIRPIIIMYIARHTMPNINTCMIIRDTLHKKLHENEQQVSNMEHPGGIKCLSAILERLLFSDQERLVSQCEDTLLHTQLQNSILNWDTINTLPDHDIKNIVASMSYSDIALLIMLDGDKATRVLARGISAHRLVWVQNEADMLRLDASQMAQSQIIKNDFFMRAKQQLYVHEEAYV